MTFSWNREHLSIRDLFFLLWEGKHIVVSIFILSLMVGALFAYNSSEKYLSKIYYNAQISMPLTETSEIQKDFYTLFLSKAFYGSWRSQNDGVSLSRSDIESTEIINGYIFEKEKSNIFVEFQSDKDGRFVAVYTQDLKAISELYEYLNYISDGIRVKYMRRVKDEYDHLYKLLKAGYPAAEVDANTLTMLQIIEKRLAGGEQVLKINAPTLPKRISRSKIATISICGLLGFLFGISLSLITVLVKTKDTNSQN